MCDYLPLVTAPWQVCPHPLEQHSWPVGQLASEEHSSTHVPTVPGGSAGQCPTDTEKMSNYLDCNQYQMFLITHDSDVFTDITNELLWMGWTYFGKEISFSVDFQCFFIHNYSGTAFCKSFVKYASIEYPKIEYCD